MGQVLLVRHGQASFGTDHYDALSELGEQQAALVGEALGRLGVIPDLVLHGGLQRQRDTAAIAAKAAGWDAPFEEDVRWDEFELAGTAAQMAASSLADAREFQAWYEARTDRWLDGAHEPGDESRVDFLGRVTAALNRAAEVSTAVVFTSGGPVASLAAELCDGGNAAYRKLMPAMANTSVTKVLSGRRGLTLLSWNAHDHLAREQVTYR